MPDTKQGFCNEKEKQIEGYFFVMCTLLTVQTHAERFTVNGVIYDSYCSSCTVYEGKYINVAVVGLSDNFSGDLVIPALPSQVMGIYFRVTEIADRAFEDNTKITSVTFPATLTRIGTYAFWGCSNLTGSLIIPNSVTSIEKGAFLDCSGLTGSLIIPNSVTSIAISAFEGCSGLTSLTIPNSVTSIAISAFEGCSGFTSLTIPNSVTSIASWAFGDCIGLTSLTIPNSVTSIACSAFWGCLGLYHLEIVADNPVYSSLDGVVYNKDRTSLLIYPSGKKDESFSIPNTVTHIGDGAFGGHSFIKSLILPEGMTSIGDDAFSWSSLQSISIPKSVHTIEGLAFKMCEYLKDITVFWSTPSEVNVFFYDADDFPYYDLFLEVDKNAVTLHVPPGTRAAYLASLVWKDFKIVDDATGIANVSKTNIIIYPNPTKDSFIVDCESFVQVKIYDMLGKEVLTQNLNGKAEINIIHLSKGIYNVCILSEGKIIGNNKIVKH